MSNIILESIRTELDRCYESNDTVVYQWMINKYRGMGFNILRNSDGKHRVISNNDTPILKF